MIRRLFVSVASAAVSVLLLGESWWSWLLAVLGGGATYWYLDRKARREVTDA
jgi:hypothetical protein